MVAAGYLRAGPQLGYRKPPSPPAGRSMVLVLVVLFAVIAPLSGVIPFLNNQPASSPRASSAATKPAAPATAKVTPGTEPGTVVIEFPPGTAEAIVNAAITPLELSVISGDVASGRWLMALPR